MLIENYLHSPVVGRKAAANFLKGTPSGARPPLHSPLPFHSLINTLLLQPIPPFNVPSLSVTESVRESVRKDTFMAKGGMQAGQVLVLTKPLGTGTIMAAAMRGEARDR